MGFKSLKASSAPAVAEQKETQKTMPEETANNPQLEKKTAVAEQKETQNTMPAETANNPQLEKKIVIRCTQEVHTWMKTRAATHQTTIQNIFDEAIQQYRLEIDKN